MAILLASFIDTFAEKARFDNYRVYSVSIRDERQLNILRELEIYPDGISFRDMPTIVGQTVDLVVPPHKLAAIHELFSTFDFHSQIKTENLQK